MLERHDVWRAFARACAKTGNRIAANIAIIAITTNSSISVNPLLFFILSSQESKGPEYYGLVKKVNQPIIGGRGEVVKMFRQNLLGVAVSVRKSHLPAPAKGGDKGRLVGIVEVAAGRK